MNRDAPAGTGAHRFGIAYGMLSAYAGHGDAGRLHGS